MSEGDLDRVLGHEDVYVHDTGMFGTDEYGAVYVVDAEEPAVIDTGTGTNRERLYESLAEIGVGDDDLLWILPTHAHLDHAGGAGYLADRYPNAELRTPEKAVRHLVDPDRLIEGTRAAVGDQWRHYAEPKPVPEDRIRGLTDGDRIDLGDRELVFHHAPGHAPHHGFFHEPDAGLVFTADAAGIYVPEIDTVRPTTPPPQFDFDRALADMDAIRELDPDTLCYAHFGPRRYEDALIEEGKRASVEWVEAVREKREELDDDAAVVEHFEETTEAAEFWNEERARADASLNVRGVLAYLDRKE